MMMMMMMMSDFLCLLALCVCTCSRKRSVWVCHPFPGTVPYGFWAPNLYRMWDLQTFPLFYEFFFTFLIMSFFAQKF